MENFKCYSNVKTHPLYQLISQWTFRLFPCMAIVNSAAMNIEVHVSFWKTTKKDKESQESLVEYCPHPASTVILLANLVSFNCYCDPQSKALA